MRENNMARPFQRPLTLFFSAVLAFVLIGLPGVGMADEATEADGAKSSKEPSESHQAAVAKINEAGGAVRRIAQNTDEVEVSLALAPPPIKDALLSSVADVENVVWLELQGTSITDQGLKKIAGMETLRRLHLERTGVSDEGLKHLGRLSELEYLNLYGTKVTDAGLEHLNVWGSDVSDEGMEKLREAMPELAVVGAAKSFVEPPPLPKKETPEFAADKVEIAAPKKLLGEGSIVRVSLPKPQFLSLAEVEVYPVGKKEKLEGKAEQSTTYRSLNATLAIDGSRGDSFSHTEKDGDVWWKFTLSESKPIGAIHIWNRRDCCAERLNGAVVEILDDEENVVWTETIEKGEAGKHYAFVGE